MGDSSVYARGASNRDERQRSGDAESVPFTAMENFANTVTSHQANITKLNSSDGEAECEEPASEAQATRYQ